MGKTFLCQSLSKHKKQSLIISCLLSTNYTVSSTEFKDYGENVRLGSDLLEHSNLYEVVKEHETSSAKFL